MRRQLEMIRADPTNSNELIIRGSVHFGETGFAAIKGKQHFAGLLDVNLVANDTETATVEIVTDDRVLMSVNLIGRASMWRWVPELGGVPHFNRIEIRCDFGTIFIPREYITSDVAGLLGGPWGHLHDALLDAGCENEAILRRALEGKAPRVGVSMFARRM